MQSNSETTKRRGVRGRVSLYLLLGAGIGAAAALLFVPRKSSGARKLLAVSPRSGTNGGVGTLPQAEFDTKKSPAFSPASDKKIAGIGQTATPAANFRKRSTRTIIPPDMRISEQRYRVAHSGRRPSNIL